MPVLVQLHGQVDPVEPDGVIHIANVLCRGELTPVAGHLSLEGH